MVAYFRNSQGSQFVGILISTLALKRTSPEVGDFPHYSLARHFIRDWLQSFVEARREYH